MRILVCVKRVPAPGAKINITAGGQAVDSSYLAFTTSPHEECAVEEAVRLVEAHGGESTVLTLGPAEAEEQLRYAASIGVNKCVLLPIETADWDPQQTAAAIATAIHGLEAEDGAFDLVLHEGLVCLALLPAADVLAHEFADDLGGRSVLGFGRRHEGIAQFRFELQREHGGFGHGQGSRKVLTSYAQ